MSRVIALVITHITMELGNLRRNRQNGEFATLMRQVPAKIKFMMYGDQQLGDMYGYVFTYQLTRKAGN